MTKLITGGTGYIGAELAHILVERGEEVVLFDVNVNNNRIEDIADKVKVVRGDLGNYPEVFNVIKDNGITEIYHMGSMLSYMSELNPWASFRSNVIGTFNVLEAARLFGVEKMMFTSTMATFALEQGDLVTDLTLQRPVLFYGCGKLYCESIGRFYNKKFGLDFRSVRYSGMIGPNVRNPGHWAPQMIEDAILGRPHECVYGTPDSLVSMIYVKDAAMAADMILRVPREKIKMMNYNVVGVSELVTAREVESTLKKRYPGTRIAYNTESTTGEVYKGFEIPNVDDSYARKEWGWKPRYATVDEIITVFESDVKNYPGRYDIS